jgi:hypothetical protein
MMTWWAIEYTAELPACYIADDKGVPTFAIHKARRFESRAAAETERDRLKLRPYLWEAVPHVTGMISRAPRGDDRGSL